MTDAQIILACAHVTRMAEILNESPNNMIDLLTGHVWCEEEAGKMKRLIIESKVEIMLNNSSSEVPVNVP